MKLKKYLPILGIVIFVYLLLKLDISNIFNEIKNADLFFLSIAMFFVFVSFFTSTLKWFVIAKQQKIDIPFYNAFKINLISGFYGFVTPSRLGSLIRIEYLKKFSKNKFGKGVSNYVLEKIFDFNSLFFLVLISGFILKDALSLSYFYYALAGIIILLALVLIFRDESKGRNFFRFFYFKFLPKKIKETAKDGFYSFYEDMPHRKYFVLFFIFNLINWIVIYSILFFISLSIGIKVPFFYFLLFMPIATLVGQIPITVSGLGTREAVMISLFGLLGIEAAKIFSVSLIGIMINGILPASIGILLMLRDKKFHAKS
ncbi:MAG TPA: lysylphosphatidylglycerol synthase transmembrane domain-containing protein [Candidatus Nanoarchaeia archaeon]|nr:lysylphosphatidylglycerol synthase transmembrane domain-containing protein [Candidatus Nanoarchaeia archaeon]